MNEPLRLLNATPDQDSVAILEEMLERARSGKIIAVAVVAVERAGAVTTSVHLGKNEREAFALIGALTAAQHRAMESINNHADPC